MKKLLCALCAALSLVACDKDQSDKPVVKIGATLPLTGNLSYVGQGAKNTFAMVMDKWAGRDTKYKYEIVFEDDALKPQQAALNTNKLISMDKVRVVMSVFGVVDRPVDDIANKNKVISLSCSYGKDSVPEYGINVGNTNEDSYAPLLKKLKQDGVKTVALVGTKAEVAEATLGHAAQHLPKDGIKVVADERYAVGETDYRLSVKKMEELHPDYYVLFGVQPMNSVFVKQYYEITGKNNIASLGSLANIDTKSLPHIDGMWTVYTVGGGEDFEKAYFKRYGSRVEGCSANLYDGLDMIITAFENVEPNPETGIPENADVLKYVKNIKTWNGAFGPMNIEPDGTIRSDIPIRIFQHGQWVKD